MEEDCWVLEPLEPLAVSLQALSMAGSTAHLLSLCDDLLQRVMHELSDSDCACAACACSALHTAILPLLELRQPKAQAAVLRRLRYAVEEREEELPLLGEGEDESVQLMLQRISASTGTHMRTPRAACALLGRERSGILARGRLHRAGR